MMLIHYCLVTVPSMYLSWWLARFITHSMPKHPWRNPDGTFNQSFEDWCRRADTRLLVLSEFMFANLVCLFALVIYFALGKS
jgi:hypothetical protein